MTGDERKRRLENLLQEGDPARRRLVLLYADRLDWRYLRDKAAAIPAEAQALASLETEATK